MEKIRALNEIAERRGQSLAQMAIAWTLRDSRVTSALIGASSIAQLEDSLAYWAVSTSPRRSLPRSTAGRPRATSTSGPTRAASSRKQGLAEKTSEGSKATPSRQNKGGYDGSVAIVLKIAWLRGEVAQLVEHTAENRGVAGSIPALATSRAC
jgi:hypothetical protein